MWFRDEKDLIAVAKAKILDNFPFAYGILSKLEIKVIDRDDTVGYVNYKGEIKISKRIFEENEGEDVINFLSYLLAHNALHFALKHPHRDNGDPLFHIACDVVVANMLKWRLPTITFHNYILQDYITPVGDNCFYVTDANGRKIFIENVHVKSAEQIYEELKNEGFAVPASYFLPKLDEDDIPQGDVKPYIEKADEALYYGANFHRRIRGDLPGELEELVKARMDVEVPFDKFIEQFIKRAIIGKKNDWTKPHYKSGILKVFIPAKKGEKSHKGVVAVDTSGSITKSNLEEFWGVVKKLVERFRLDLTLITCDVKITDVEKLKKKLPNERTFVGRGGTDFRPVFEKAEELKAKFLIFLTDGYGLFPSEPPRIPTLWVTPPDVFFDPPFGSVVKIKKVKS